MLRVVIGDYVIKKSGSGLVFGKPYTVEKDGKLVENINQPSYFPTIESLLKTMPDRMLRETSEATTLRELIADFREYQHMVEKATRDIDIDWQQKLSGVGGGV